VGRVRAATLRRDVVAVVLKLLVDPCVFVNVTGTFGLIESVALPPLSGPT
jgi:hypothetical protein